MEWGRQVLFSLGLVVMLLRGCGAAYKGMLVGSLSNLQHGVSGTVYAMNRNTIQIVNFNYDGRAPAGRFYVGYHGTAPHTRGTPLLNEMGSTAKLGKYESQTVILSQPKDLDVTIIRWFSVWCTSFDEDFGHVAFPNDFTGPVRQALGEFSQLAHGLSSGSVYLEDTKTISINTFRYDGDGPDAYFILGVNSVGSAGYDKIPDEANSTSIAHAYSGQSIKLVLPKDISIHGYTYLSLYCIAATQSFGSVNIQIDIPVPFHPVTIAEMKLDGSSDLSNCEQLSDNYNIAWSIDETHITFEFVSVLEPKSYMAFGLSGSQTDSIMKGGDVIVATYSQAGFPMAVDYYLEDYAQCSLRKGACPDEKSIGNQDLRVPGGSKNNQIVKVKVERALNTGDASDKVYTRDQHHYIIWARGKLNDDMVVTKHDERLTGKKQLHFGRTPLSTCKPIVPIAPTPTEHWREQRLSGKETQVFSVRLGPTGGDKGYKAITGKQSWGIAYYVNGLLIPRIELRRGGTYTFLVEGGHDKTNTAKYHPLYISTDAKGGYRKQFANMQSMHQVFAGINPDTRRPTPDSLGRYCEYKQDGGMVTADQSETFAMFKSTLSKKCDAGPAAGKLVFSPDESTPDLLYYQCFTHPGLGWKIDVVDEYSSGSTLHTTTLAAIFVAFTLAILHH